MKTDSKTAFRTYLIYQFEDALLQSSRGVSKAEAVGMLILAFLDEAVQEIKSETLAAEVRSILWEEMELNSDK